jgi:hypothetical protein
MTLYTIEAKGCFVPSTVAYTREANACDAISGYQEGIAAAWTDGTYWIDNDGVTLVGWIEADGTYFPSLEVLAAVNA